MDTNISTALMRTENLKVHFPVYKNGVFRRIIGHVRAVDGIDIVVNKGETVGLVGESGCGKTTLGHAILQLVKSTSGRVWLKDTDLNDLTRKALRIFRTNMQVVFQDPFSSLNSRITIGDLVEEPLIVHDLMKSKKARKERVQSVLEMVGINPDYMDRYPTAFSGGQRQRVCIARALVVEPSFLVCDEPVSALDVSIQAQIINLLVDIKKQKDLSYLFISHDLSVVRHISDRVVVMYLGKIVEHAKTESLFTQPLHPYTIALLSAVPVPDPLIEQKREKIYLSGDLPNPANPPKGCNFSTRCPRVMEVCRELEPQLRNMSNGSSVACHLYSE